MSAGEEEGHSEREIALSLGVVAPAEVLAHPLVAAQAIDRPVRERLVSTYHDTAERALAGEGIVLRVRRRGRSLVQTVKRGGPKGAGLAARHEWETPLSSRAPQWPPEVPGETGVLLARIAAVAPVRPLFATDFTRTRQLLATPAGDVVELAIDVGAIRAGQESVPVAEAEIELKRGTPAALFDLALGLCADLPLRLQLVSKGERGLLLATGDGPRAVKASRPCLEPEMTVADAAALVIPSAAAHAMNNAPAIMEGSQPVEGVHQMRVGLRRLRAALSVFAPPITGRDRRQLRGLVGPALGALGPARDLDVFLDEILAPVLRACGEDEAIAAFVAEAEALRTRSRESLAGLLASTETTRSWLRLGRWLVGPPVESSEPLVDFSQAVLRKRARRVKRAGKRAGDGPVEELHALRIELKKLRYAGEFFASLYDPERTRPALKALRRAQDALGRLNDLAVCDEVLARIAGEAPKGRARPVGKGAERIAAALRQRQGKVRAEAEAAYAAFAEIRPFWK